MSLQDGTIALVSEALNLDPKNISETTGLGHTLEWDSLAHMRLILLIEAQTGKALTPEEIIMLSNAAEVETLLA